MQKGLQMDKTGTGKKTPVVPRRYVETILYLADRMSHTGGEVNSVERRMVDDLAEAVGMPGFRHQPDFRTLTDQNACETLDLATAKTAALVVISLVLKADSERPPEETEYFHKIRTLLETDPISVPSDLEEHKKLALDYLGVQAPLPGLPE